MSRYTPHTAESAPEASRAGLEKAARKFGRLPNLIAVMAESPATLDAYLALHGNFEQTAFSPGERQVLLLAVSTVNACAYCVAAHTMGGRMAGLSDAVVEAIRDGKPIPDVRLAALSGFAAAMVEKRGWVTDAQVAAFLDAGFTKAHVFEVVLAVSMKTLSNYINHIADTPLDAALEAHRWTRPKKAA